jgi:hypothetical protein
MNQPLEEAGMADPRVSFRLVRAVRNLEFRQKLLGARSEEERIRMLAEFLPDFAHETAREQAIKNAAPRNGHAHHNGNGNGSKPQ